MAATFSVKDVAVSIMVESSWSMVRAVAAVAVRCQRKHGTLIVLGGSVLVHGLLLFIPIRYKMDNEEPSQPPPQGPLVVRLSQESMLAPPIKRQGKGERQQFSNAPVTTKNTDEGMKSFVAAL